MNIDNLVIELTRKCNARCDHCLRGKAESIDLDPAYLDSLFSKLESVGSLTLTGGEPSLVPYLIEATIDAAERHGVDVGSFYIATNAISVSPEFLSAVMRLWLFCSDNEISRLEWSNDQFHPETDETRKLEVFKFAGPKFEEDFYDYPRGSLIQEGRGMDWDGRQNRRESFEIWEDSVQDGAVSLNCEGNIVGGCDWSFESQREPENIICHVDELSLEKFEAFCEIEEAA